MKQRIIYWWRAVTEDNLSDWWMRIRIVCYFIRRQMRSGGNIRLLKSRWSSRGRRSRWRMKGSDKEGKMERYYNGPKSKLMDDLYDRLIEHTGDPSEFQDWSILSLYIAREIEQIEIKHLAALEAAVKEKDEQNQTTLFRMKSVYDKDCKELREQIAALTAELSECRIVMVKDSLINAKQAEEIGRLRTALENYQTDTGNRPGYEPWEYYCNRYATFIFP